MACIARGMSRKSVHQARIDVMVPRSRRGGVHEKAPRDAGRGRSGMLLDLLFAGPGLLFAVAAVVHAYALRQILKVMLSIGRRLDALNESVTSRAPPVSTDDTA